ncbi:response regulator [Paenibacillus nasutitermitis]|uniref:Two-component system, response regulator YesN n=1 Tax=Paenibacillus nasutitermitis TaxID=1652958 RepID=A0A917DZW7_9BACL|nr:response regulator [Paenibacillus nasutitermitis]GGD85379.1 hypothetical protein GCM10010911_49770 [Paenibacillus nasutitermitis]
MRRLLLVDDEPFIVNGMAALIKECEFLQLEVYKSYSADEALEWLQRTAMDIVLTDISMPGMDGLELQRHVLHNWPRCKVIFLTGYDEFSYVKEAVHNRAADYILKTEGDQAILAAVERAVMEIDKELADSLQLAQTRARLQVALPSLQKEWVQQLLLEETAASSRSMQEQLDELDLGLISDQPVFLVMAKVDLHNDLPNPDKALLLYALQNIADEYWQSYVRQCSFALDQSRVIWLIQDGDDSGGRSLVRFVHEVVERIQQTSRELLKLDVSFALSAEMCDWKMIASQYERLQRLLRSSLGIGQELLLEGSEDSAGDGVQHAALQHMVRLVARLERHLEHSERLEWLAGMDELIGDKTLMPLPDIRQIASYRLVAVLMTYAMNEDMQHVLLEERMEQLTHSATYAEWQDTMRSMAKTGDILCSYKENRADQHGRNLVLRIRQYIDAHLAGDLSLTRIGEEVAYNPYYLSKLYKQLTGENLSDAIMTIRLNEAKRMLKDTDDKIQNIAAGVGFDSAAYFTRFFKKTTDRTPLEYRESSRK